MEIRSYAPGDREQVVEICIATGDAGQDARTTYEHPELLAWIYVLPYIELEPSLAFVATDDLGVAGYLVATLDARAFAERLERSWWPALRERYPLDATVRPADRRLVELVHHPSRPPAPAASHPSELHIDLLPRARGTGVGRRLMTTAFDALRAAGSKGVHLGVDRRNERALGFYRHLGMTEKPAAGAVFFTFDLDG